MRNIRSISTHLLDRAKGFFLGFCLIFCTCILHAQPVPNFIEKDINGQAHDLHAYLDEGKVVILEVFATWCTNCWSLHKEELLSKLYSTYGPEGTDQLVILYVEGDIETPDEFLHGENSFGDWTMDIAFPIFNPETISQEFIKVFAPQGVPTTNIICPSTKEIIADVFEDDLSEIISILQQCNTISNVNDLQLLGRDSAINSVCNTSDLRLKVLNSGTEDVTSFKVVALEANGNEFASLNYDTLIQSGELANINLGEFVFPDILMEQQVTLHIEHVDDVPLNNYQAITFNHALEVRNELHLIIKADVWTEVDNTRWWIEDSAGEIVVPVTHLVAESHTDEFFNLENRDCFTFVIADDFGNGMLFGSVTLLSSEGALLYSGSYFRERGEASFEYLGSATTASTSLDPDKYELQLSPNIVSGVLKVGYEIPDNQKVEFQIINLQGILLAKHSVSAIQGKNNWAYNTPHLPNGIYLLQMNTAQGTLTRKFIKQ